MASTTLSRTPSSAGSQTKSTFSLWFKTSEITATQRVITFFNVDATAKHIFRLNTDDKLYIRNKVGNVFILDVATTRVFRDVNAWYHVVVAIDTTQATASDRCKVYINGVQETSFDTATYPSQNANLTMNTTSETVYIGSETATGNYWNGLMSHYHYIDGTAYDASTFGEFDANGVWKPKTSPSVTYGTNGFFLKFENSGSMGTDSSGNGNNFTVNGSLTQTLDTPSNVYATLNPLHWGGSTSAQYYYGNTQFYNSNNAVYPYSHSTLAPSQGKWYAEFTNQQGGMVGITDGKATATYLGEGANDIGIYYSVAGNTQLYVGSASSSQISASAYTSSNKLMVAMDLDNLKAYFGIDGTWFNSADPVAGTGGTTIPTSTTGVYHFTVGDLSGSASPTIDCNFGNGVWRTTPLSGTTYSDANSQGIFSHSVPTGYYALNTKNLATYG